MVIRAQRFWNSVHDTSIGLAGTLYVGRSTFLNDPPRESVGILALSNTGQKLWSSDAQVGPVVYPPALSVDKTVLFVGTNDGNLFVLNARNGKIMAKWSIGGKALMPVPYGGTVFVATQTPTFMSKVYALNVQNGYHQWSHEFRDGSPSHVMMVGPDGRCTYLATILSSHLRITVAPPYKWEASTEVEWRLDARIAGLVVIAILAVAVVFAVRYDSKRA